MLLQMNTPIILNEEQQRVVDLLTRMCQKVSLFDHNGLPTCRCLMSEQKIVDIFFTETEAIASYNDATDFDCGESSCDLIEVTEDTIESLRNIVANLDQYVNGLGNTQHAKDLQDFLVS
ncbi:MAG: hypothetical protein RL709_231 [Pseudomonadota bacterium]|jgi:hypothetical protein